MSVEIINDFPPFFNKIKELNPPRDAVFSFNGKIYNPSGREIPQDIIIHEQVHFEQQGKFSDGWWWKYIRDLDFRKEQEVEAFSKQLKFVKKLYTKQGVKEALKEMAENLSKNYGLNINYYQASTLIRKWRNRKK